jgi:hypothetical protein
LGATTTSLEPTACPLGPEARLGNPRCVKTMIFMAVGVRQQALRPQRKQCRLSGTTGLGCARMGKGKTEPPTRPGPEALDIGSNHKADAFPLTPWYAGWGPPQWLGNAGDASVSRGIHLIRTSAMYPQGFHQKYCLGGPISSHRRTARVYLLGLGRFD